MKLPARRLITLLYAFAAPLVCLAGPDDSPGEANNNSVEEITVLGSRLSAPEPQPPETIERDRVVAMQSATLAEMMRVLPGISVIEPGGPGGVTELYIRGAEANFTTVFINGVLMNDPTDSRGGGFDFSSISPVEINRIELVRGPFSALYGSGALAGAINIDTRAPNSEKPGSLFQATVGSDDYWQLGASIYGPVARGHAGLSANHVDFGELTDGSTRTISSLNGNYRGELRDNLDFDLTLRLNERDRTSFPTGSGGSRLAVSRMLETGDAEEASLGASTTWSSGGKSFFASLSYLDRDELVDIPGIAPGVFPGTPALTADTQFDRLVLTVQAAFETANGFEWGAGLEYRDEQGESSGALDFGGFGIPTDFRHDRETVAPFVEGRVQLGERITAFAGLRHDDFSDTDSTTSPRVGVVYRHAPEGARFTAVWGEGRKAPSFYALGDPLVGNPQLEPEDSEGWDVELEVPLADNEYTLTVSAYQSEYSNLVDFDFATFRLVNRSNVDTEGFEVQLAGTPNDRLSWQVFLAKNENEVDGVKNALLQRPEEAAGAWLYWKPNDDWNLVLSAKHEGSRQSSSIPGGFETLASFTRVDFAVGRMLGRDLQVQLAVDNLFDEDYEAEAGFPSPGRQVRLALRRGL